MTTLQPTLFMFPVWKHHFDVLYHGELLGTVVLHIAGVHNVLNALAAIAAVRYVGISFEDAVKGLGNFHGAAGRFDKKGEAAVLPL